MKLFHILLSLALCSTISLTACNAGPQPAPVEAPTATAVSLLTQPESTPTTLVESANAATTEPLPVTLPSTPTLAPTLPPEPTGTNTLVPTATPLPSPTPVPAPQVTVPDSSTTAINVRSGPGTDYPVLDQFEPGQSVAVTGRNDNNSWWQVSLADDTLGWVFGELVQLSGPAEGIPVAEAPPPPPTATPQAEAEAKAEEDGGEDDPQTPEELEEKLQCGQDFCVTYQTMVPIWENGGCIGNHSIYVTVLQGPPPGTPMDGVVVGDTFNNIEVASGDKGPGTAEVTLWMNSMSLKVKRHIDGTPFSSEESYSFTSHDELIPAEVLAANGYCDGSVEKCRWAQQNNQVCRGHYSYRVTFHKFN